MDRAADIRVRTRTIVASPDTEVIRQSGETEVLRVPEGKPPADVPGAIVQTTQGNDSGGRDPMDRGGARVRGTIRVTEAVPGHSIEGLRIRNCKAITRRVLRMQKGIGVLIVIPNTTSQATQIVRPNGVPTLCGQEMVERFLR